MKTNDTPLPSSQAEKHHVVFVWPWFLSVSCHNQPSPPPHRILFSAVNNSTADRLFSNKVLIEITHTHHHGSHMYGQMEAGFMMWPSLLPSSPLSNCSATSLTFLLHLFLYLLLLFLLHLFYQFTYDWMWLIHPFSLTHSAYTGPFSLHLCVYLVFLSPQCLFCLNEISLLKNSEWQEWDFIYCSSYYFGLISSGSNWGSVLKWFYGKNIMFLWNNKTLTC